MRSSNIGGRWHAALHCYFGIDMIPMATSILTMMPTAIWTIGSQSYLVTNHAAFVKTRL
ncbi:hypothetical protein [Peribacillus sp. SCS-37]|uniref:hypothetical protein n=1 Tax=Paraperibacillus esterisolvens TaxID=3115296 RepID=UPI0039059A91